MRKFAEFSHIAFRHTFPPINLIIFGVVFLLIQFGSVEEGIFLGIIVVVNIFMGFIQDVRAWIALERLQVLTAVRSMRLNNDGTVTPVRAEDIQKGDKIKLRLGDQVPLDSVLVESDNLEVNEGLITGESDSFPREKGAGVLAGSIVTSGVGVIQASTMFGESRIAKMTQGLKRYSANPSPIQLAVERIIKYTVWTLLGSVAFVVARGAILSEPGARVVETIGALASILVPQGMVVSTTLLFTFGAIHFYRRHVLLQEVNAVEKFGRIKNLCMDKTGTLTENVLTVERMEVPESTDQKEARNLATAYVKRSGDSSHVIHAVEGYLHQDFHGQVTQSLAFSSWRGYGGITLKDGVSHDIVLAGPSDIFLPHLETKEERTWLEKFSATHARAGKYVLCMVRQHGGSVPQTLSHRRVSVLAVFVLEDKLREGIKDTVDFFQGRGVTIRILSGDNADTVRAIARAAGIKNTDALVTGAEMTGWDTADYTANAKRFTIFARILPEQKEKIVEALKSDGFTAMIGDGANDALAVKKADLGMAISDGAPATRQVAAVVLTHNNFIELPKGARLAYSMIENIETYASIFMNQTFIGFFSFLFLSLAGFDFPLTPLNITFISYFAIGFPYLLISFWAIRPSDKVVPISRRPFLSRVLPFSGALACVETVGVLAMFVFGGSILRLSWDEIGTMFVLAFMAFGWLFFLFAPYVFSIVVGRDQQLQLIGLGGIEVIILYAAFHQPLVLHFFHLTFPSTGTVMAVLGIAAACGVIEFLLSKGTFFASPPPLEDD